MKHKIFGLLLVLLVVFTATAQNEKQLTQRWLQLWKDKTGEVTYYEKQYEYKEGEKVEKIYTNDEVASVLSLLHNNEFETQSLGFQFGRDCYQLPINWGGTWQAKKDTLWLTTILDFNCGWDPAPGIDAKAPGPQKRKIPFLVTEFSADKMSLKCLEYTSTRDLYFISEKAFIQLLQQKHEKELKKHKATMYSQLQPTEGGLLLDENGKPFSGTTIAYYMNNHYYKNLNKQLIREYKNGVQDGLEMSFFSNGEVQSKVEYKDGKANGSFKRWRETNDGIKLHMEGEMKDGEYFGTLKRYGYYNQLESQAEYKLGGKDRYVEYFQYIDGKQHVKTEGAYTIRGKQGKWKYYDKEGKLEREEVYEKGMKQQK